MLPSICVLGQKRTTGPKKGESFGHKFQKAVSSAWGWQEQILRMERRGESGDWYFLTSLSPSLLHIAHFLTLSCQMGNPLSRHLVYGFQIYHLTLFQAATFTTNHSSTSQARALTTVSTATSSTATSSWYSNKSSTAISQAGARITVHMRDTSSAIRLAQLYSQWQCDQLLLCQSNWFHAIGPSKNATMIFLLQSCFGNVELESWGFSLHNKIGNLLAFFPSTCYDAIASDTAEEPLGGLKGHPASLWRD